MSARRLVARETPSPEPCEMRTHDDDGIPYLHPRRIPRADELLAAAVAAALAGKTKEKPLPPALRDPLPGPPVTRKRRFATSEGPQPPREPSPPPVRRSAKQPEHFDDARYKRQRPPYPKDAPPKPKSSAFKTSWERPAQRLPNPGVAAIEASLPGPPPPRVILEAGPPKRYRYAPEVRRLLGFDPLEKAKWRGGEEEKVPIVGAENVSRLRCGRARARRAGHASCCRSRCCEAGCAMPALAALGRCRALRRLLAAASRRCERCFWILLLPLPRRMRVPRLAHEVCCALRVLRRLREACCAPELWLFALVRSSRSHVPRMHCQGCC
jgi:hypothetical protein